MSDKKQFVINFATQILFCIINLSISFFLVPHIVSSIDGSAYGFINLSNDFVNYASLITVALNSIAGRYITLAIHKKKVKEANTYYNSVIIANIIMALVITVPLLVFTMYIDKFLNIPIDIVNDVKLLFIIVFTNFILSLITSVLTVATFATNKLYLNSIASITSQVSRCIILLILYSFFKTSVWYVGFASLISTLILIIANYKFTRKLTPQLYFDYKLFDFKCIKEMLKNGIWNTVNRLSGILQNGLDLLISNVFVSSAAMGIIALPRTITSIIFSLFGSIASIFNPKIMQAYAEDDFESMKRQLDFAIKFTSIFSNICIAVFVVLGTEFYHLWVPTQDSQFLYLLSIIALLSLSIGIPLEPVYCIHTSTNKIKKPAIFGLVSSLITIIIVILGIMFTNDDKIKIILISGVSSFVSIFRLGIYIPIYTAHLLNEKSTYFYPLIGKYLFSLSLCAVVGLLIKQILPVNNFIVFFISCAVLVVINFIINFTINFNKEEKTKIMLIIKNRSLN